MVERLAASSLIRAASRSLERSRCPGSLICVAVFLALFCAILVSRAFGAPAMPDTPQVSKIEPARLARGSQATVKVSGKSFADGAKVSFANPGITVLGTTFKKASELDVQIQVATDAPTGATSLFVVNPNDSEVEEPFDVVEGPPGGTASPAGGAAPTGVESPSPAAGPAPQPAAKSSTKGATANSLQFDVLSLQNVASILTSQGKSGGTLAYVGGKLTYTEAGQKVFGVKPAEIKEIAPNIILGMNTGSFHVILNSGKMYNFVAASLKPADSLSIIDALHRAMR